VQILLFFASPTETTNGTTVRRRQVNVTNKNRKYRHMHFVVAKPNYEAAPPGESRP
jgi:hypothetical protein